MWRWRSWPDIRGRAALGQIASSALYWLAPGFLFSFIAGGLSAWVLSVEVVR